jgi:hypothetical protein
MSRLRMAFACLRGLWMMNDCIIFVGVGLEPRF